MKQAWLVFNALYELARYDVVSSWRGSANIHPPLPQRVCRRCPPFWKKAYRFSESVGLVLVTSKVVFPNLTI